MKPFLDDDFLLKTDAAKRLYHEHAKFMPILDFHSHLPPEEVAGDARFDNIARIWLGGDHYKWRAMRANGIGERFITGDATDEEKFAAWARTVPKTIGNPLYHWTHLELRRYFGVDELLSETTAPAIWKTCNEVLTRPEFSVRGLLKAMNVRAVCTTDDPADDLAHHKTYARETAGKQTVALAPTFRPDKVMSVADVPAWNAYLKKLEAAAGVEVLSFDGLVKALDNRHAVFHEAGGRLSDHGLERAPAIEASPAELDQLLGRLLKGEPLSLTEAEAFQTGVMTAVGHMNHQRGWTMQLHLGAIRNLNSRMLQSLGPNTGYDGLGDETQAKPLARLLDLMNRNGLPKMILYTLNPAWNEAFASIAGCFEDGTAPGRVQFGSAWWFNDQLDGMTRQLTTAAQFGLLSRFVGMLTDSRSFLSFPRHEYFRRLVCDVIGTWVENGEAPADFELLGGMVRDIAFNNAFNSLGLPGSESMKMTFRWFGEADDPIPLKYIRQIPGVSGIVGALYNVEVGEAWPEDKIGALKKTVNAAGLSLEVIESVNVHEDIKLGAPSRDRAIENYITTIRRLGKAGFKVICYNFMPVFDWFRTDLARELPDGSNALFYEAAVAQSLSPQAIVKKIAEESKGFVLPGWEPARLAKLEQLFEQYADVDAERLFANLGYFLKAVVPVCEEVGMAMGIHPDDPPWPIFGLPRIVHGQTNLDRILKLVDSPANGLTLCSGSLGADPQNDIPALVRRYAGQGRVPFAHIRNIKHLTDGDFTESAHFSTDGSLDLYEIVKAYHDAGFDGYIRPDHGRMIWDEQGRPGYGLNDRALGIAYLNGLWEAVEKGKLRDSMTRRAI